MHPQRAHRLIALSVTLCGAFNNAHPRVGPRTETEQTLLSWRRCCCDKVLQEIVPWVFVHRSWGDIPPTMCGTYGTTAMIAPRL